MIISANRSISPKRAQKYIIKRIMKQKGIPEKYSEAKKRLDIRQEVSVKMRDVVKGRTTPDKPKPSKGNVSFAKLLNKNPPIFSYPNKLKTDKQKFIYLKDLLERGHINQQIFTDLSDMLVLKEDKPRRQSKSSRIEELDRVCGDLFNF